MADERPWAGRRLHLIGLGGAGMSGYARVATQLGAAVSGSDRADSVGLRALLDDRPRREAMGRVSASLARPDAAQRIAEEELAATGAAR